VPPYGIWFSVAMECQNMDRARKGQVRHMQSWLGRPAAGGNALTFLFTLSCICMQLNERRVIALFLAASTSH